MGSGYKSFTQLMRKHLFFRDGYNLFMDGSCHGVSSVRPRSRICPSRKSVGVPRGYVPHWSQDACPRRGGREPSDRWKGEGGALSPPRTPFPPWGTPSAAGVAEEHSVPPILSIKGNCQNHGKRNAYSQCWLTCQVI